MKRKVLVAALALLVLTAGCGEDEGPGDQPQLTVSAASSLKGAFEAYGEDFEAARTRFSFAGSDELAAQIRRGVKPEVYAAADTRLPRQLYRQGEVARPTVFARNRLVLAVPAGSNGVRRLDDLARPGVDLVVGARSVPVGAYTRRLLGRLPPGQERAILANVRSGEPDVKGVVGKLAQGAADAGFVYATDVKAAGGRIRAIRLPDSLELRVEYAAAVVRGTRNPVRARLFIRGLLAGSGAQALRGAGFEPPPR